MKPHQCWFATDMNNLVLSRPKPVSQQGGQEHRCNKLPDPLKLQVEKWLA
jgi:hypothetical protein